MTTVVSDVVDLGGAEVTVTTGAGPRVLGYRRGGMKAPFASLPDAFIDHPAVGRFRFVGGHRLWRAPEQPEVTYHRDDEGAALRRDGDTVVLSSAADGHGVVKEIRLHQRGDATVVDHLLHNTGGGAVIAAPWAITQLAIGGTAFLPQAVGPTDPDGVAPNRRLVLWPYTDLADPGVVHRTDRIEVTAAAESGRLKIGWPNTRGWLGYRSGDVLFVKWAAVTDAAARYADHGATAQCYRDGRFVELETLGALVEIAPGGDVTHREVWELHEVAAADLDALLAGLPAVHPEVTR